MERASLIGESLRLTRWRSLGGDCLGGGFEKMIEITFAQSAFKEPVVARWSLRLERNMSLFATGGRPRMIYKDLTIKDFSSSLTNVLKWGEKNLVQVLLDWGCGNCTWLFKITPSPCQRFVEKCANVLDKYTTLFYKTKWKISLQVPCMHSPPCITFCEFNSIP